MHMLHGDLLVDNFTGEALTPVLVSLRKHVIDYVSNDYYHVLPKGLYNSLND